MTDKATTRIIGKDLPNIPWQEPDGTERLPLWRYTRNPIIERFATKNSNSIFNSAVVSFEDGFAGVFRCDSKSISMDIFAGFSKDGIHWEISDEPIAFQGRTPRWQNGISAMTQEYALSRTGTTSHGAMAIMSTRPSV